MEMESIVAVNGHNLPVSTDLLFGQSLPVESLAADQVQQKTVDTGNEGIRSQKETSKEGRVVK
jgi:hypothetical protein